jgi:hypothetical protein
MNNKYLIIDKPSRVELKDGIPYAIAQLTNQIEANGDTWEFALNTEISLKVVDEAFQIFVKNIPIESYTHIMLRGHHSRRDYEIKQMIVEYIESYNKTHKESNIKVHNAQFIKTLPHYTKMYQAMVCAQNQIPYLNTYYKSAGNYNVNELVDKGDIKTDKVIMKHYTGKNDLRWIDGKQKIKKNIFMIEKAEDFNQENFKKKDKSAFFMQEFIPIGEDFRIFMKGDKYIGGWKRKATTSFITVDKGEYSNYNNPSKEILDLSKRTAKAFKSDFVAIDIIEKDGKPYVLEVNMNPGFKAYENKVEGTIGVDKADIAKEIIESF